MRLSYCSTQGHGISTDNFACISNTVVEVNLKMLQVVDQLNNAITLTTFPKRIVSLVPSQSELLFHLELTDEVVGITKFCIHPTKWFKTKTRVGGTKTVSIEKVYALKPDLIIANKEENVREQIEAMRNIAPVYISDINDLQGALSMIKDIGAIVGKAKIADQLINRIELEFQKLSSKAGDTTLSSAAGLHPIRNSLSMPGIQTSATKIRTAYLIWKDPFMAAGGDTFINDMLDRCSFENILSSFSRYPQIDVPFLQSLHCELLLLSSEPYPFKQKHIDELQQQLKNTTILLVDGEMFSWYGSRLIKAASYFQQLVATISIKH
jgi:ABC-type Fe3+-hydroxamate transport system substrate-binding protein